MYSGLVVLKFVRLATPGRMILIHHCSGKDQSPKLLGTDASDIFLQMQDLSRKVGCWALGVQ